MLVHDFGRGDDARKYDGSVICPWNVNEWRLRRELFRSAHFKVTCAISLCCWREGSPNAAVHDRKEREGVSRFRGQIRIKNLQREITEMLRPLELRHKMYAIEDFKDKCVIVTGAGTGIGSAAAIQFAKQGAKVLVADINEKSANEVVVEIRALGGVAVAVAGDLSDQAVIEKVVSISVQVHGGLDVLVNNAGIMVSMSANDEVSV